jgi:chromosome segregation ATPase
VSGTYGLEKFAHLEDKIYRTVEQFKREREERQALEQEMLALRGELGRVTDENERLESHVERLLGERDAIRRKVESMLDAIALLDPELAETAKS